MSEIFGYWRTVKGRCGVCHRTRDKMYEVREGKVVGQFCGRHCWEMALKKTEEAEKDPLKKVVKEETPDVSYFR